MNTSPHWTKATLGGLGFPLALVVVWMALGVSQRAGVQAIRDFLWLLPLVHLSLAAMMTQLAGGRLPRLSDAARDLAGLAMVLVVGLACSFVAVGEVGTLMVAGLTIAAVIGWAGRVWNSRSLKGLALAAAAAHFGLTFFAPHHAPAMTPPLLTAVALLGVFATWLEWSRSQRPS